jgi:hypothetical protein
MTKLYRIRTKLLIATNPDRHLEPGTLTNLEWLNERKRERLMKLGKISEASPPPFEALGKKWKGRATRLRKADIGGIVALINADAEELSAKVGVKPKTVIGWQEEARACLVVPAPKG